MSAADRIKAAFAARRTMLNQGDQIMGWNHAMLLQSDIQQVLDQREELLMALTILLREVESPAGSLSNRILVIDVARVAIEKAQGEP